MRSVRKSSFVTRMIRGSCSIRSRRPRRLKSRSNASAMSSSCMGRPSTVSTAIACSTRLPGQKTSFPLSRRRPSTWSTAQARCSSTTPRSTSSPPERARLPVGPPSTAGTSLMEGPPEAAAANLLCLPFPHHVGEVGAEGRTRPTCRRHRRRAERRCQERSLRDRRTAGCRAHRTKRPCAEAIHSSSRVLSFVSTCRMRSRVTPNSNPSSSRVAPSNGSAVDAGLPRLARQVRTSSHAVGQRIEMTRGHGTASVALTTSATSAGASPRLRTVSASSQCCGT